MEQHLFGLTARMPPASGRPPMMVLNPGQALEYVDSDLGCLGDTPVSGLGGQILDELLRRRSILSRIDWEIHRLI